MGVRVIEVLLKIVAFYGYLHLYFYRSPEETQNYLSAQRTRSEVFDQTAQMRILI